jgi:hypothetical protein
MQDKCGTKSEKKGRQRKDKTRQVIKRSARELINHADDYSRIRGKENKCNDTKIYVYQRKGDRVKKNHDAIRNICSANKKEM